jgi:acyl-CoA synthetase (AMP-forming)/AMP-acid ligase II
MAIRLTNGNEYLEAMVGSFAARAVPCNVNYRYVADELSALFADMQPAAVVFHSSFAHAVVAAVEQLEAPPRLLLQVGDAPTVELVPGAIEYEAALASATQFTAHDLAPDDRYAIFTGGTTGARKGVLWRQDDYIVGCLGITQGGVPFPSGRLRQARPGTRPDGHRGADLARDRRRRGIPAQQRAADARAQHRRHGSARTELLQ